MIWLHKASHQQSASLVKCEWLTLNKECLHRFSFADIKRIACLSHEFKHRPWLNVQIKSFYSCRIATFNVGPIDKTYLTIYAVWTFWLTQTEKGNGGNEDFYRELSNFPRWICMTRPARFGFYFSNERGFRRICVNKGHCRIQGLSNEGNTTATQAWNNLCSLECPTKSYINLQFW